MKHIILITLSFLFYTNIATAQSFDATVNRTSLPEGETLVLTLELKDVDTSASPDLSALSRDFTVLSVSNGYRTQITNGSVAKSRQWNLVMIPNNTGNITIPSIKLANYETQPIIVSVTAAGSKDQIAQASSQPDSAKFKITGNVNNSSPYVQQQINYQLKIYDAGGLQGEAPYFATTNDDWIIKSLGAPKVETKIINGRSLREITFDYALFAQKSGQLTIPEVKFSGYYLTQNTRQDPFARFFDDDDFFAGFGLNSVFASKQPVILSTKPITIDVKPAPATATGWWLPAKDIKLSAEFSNRPPQFKVGEPINRTIYLKAVGVTDSQLPEIKFATVSGIKQYPEKPLTEMKVENSDIVSLAKINNVYIPETGGPITLPAINVQWFNTTTGQFEIATIPEYQTVVLGKTSAQQHNIASSMSPQATSAPIVEQSAEQITQSNSINNTTIIILLLGAFVIGIILTLLLLKLFSHLGDKNKHRNTIISAAKAHNLRLLRDELILWGQKHYPHKNINNLQDIADIFNNPVFNRELEKIRETLYSETEKNWNHDEFLKIFKHLAKKAVTMQKNTTEPLPKLYKN